MAKLFYETINVPDDLLSLYERKAVIDEDMIYHMIKQCDGLTKSEIFQIYSKYKIKISESSISRSLSNLADKLQLMKTKEKRTGIWKKGNSVFVLVTDENIDQAKVLLKNTPKNIRLKRFEIKLVLSSINYVLENKQDLPTDLSKKLNIIFKQLTKIK
jgi:arginine repressor